MAPSERVAMPSGYRYLRHLGAGGFGDVHLAEHVATGRRVAVKHIQRHALGDPATLERFRREAQVLAATDVETVVRVYDLDTTSDPAFLVMEYVPGAALWDLMERGRLPPSQALVVLRDVADALAAMAARGLVHRDIKPSNVFVLPTGRAKLGDFGLARAVADDSGFRTAGAPAGTPAYFPPEVSSGVAEATPESDAYSFAVMAYEVLTGSRPIEAPDAVSLVTAHWHQPPRPVTDAMPGFPAEAADVLMRALAKEPQGRPLPVQVVTALAAVPAERWPTASLPPVPVPAAPPPGGTDGTGSAAPPTVRTPVAPAVAGTPDPAGRRRTRGRRWVVLAGVVGLVVAGATALGWGLLRSGGPDPAAEPLGVEAASLVADPPRARCPRAQVTLVLTVRTNGAGGELTVSWVLPDGSAGPRQSLAVADGQREVRATLDVSLSGTRPVTGDAAAVVAPSGLRAAAPVRYTCGRLSPG